MTRLLIANRGEIALRIIRTATELELETIAVHAEDDADSPHVHAADEAVALGAMAMAAGSFRIREFTVAWPTGEIGGMGLEGAVRLGFSKELAALDDPTERQSLFDTLVEAAYQHGGAPTSATTFELDDVIDPADNRGWIARLRRREEGNGR